MGKNRRSKRNRSTTTEDSSLVDITAVNLRTAGPVTRLRGVLAGVDGRLEYVSGKLGKWSGQQESIQETAVKVETLRTNLAEIGRELEALEQSGFAPERTSFTAKVEEGDYVAVLEKYYSRYEDLVSEEGMRKMKVIKRRPGRSGGLILQTANGERVQAAVAHVSRLSNV